MQNTDFSLLDFVHHLMLGRRLNYLVKQAGPSKMWVRWSLSPGDSKQGLESRLASAARAHFLKSAKMTEIAAGHPRRPRSATTSYAGLLRGEAVDLRSYRGGGSAVVTVKTAPRHRRPHDRVKINDLGE